jgi:integrase
MGTSHQKGWVSVRGKKWYGYFRRTVLDPETNEAKTVSTPIALGLKSQMSKFQAREKLVEEIAKLTGPPAVDDSIKNGAVTFGWFVRNRFYPLKEAKWKEETAKVKKLLIQSDLVDEFEDVPLENFDKFTLQLHINKLAKTRSKDTVLQMRAYMRDIFAEAVDQDFLAKDPAHKVETPTLLLRETDKTTLSWDQLRGVLAKTDLRDWILLQLDMANALRPGELFGLRWKCFDAAACSIQLMETTYKGKIRSWGKTRGSLTTIPIAEELVLDLVEWQQQCPDPSPEAFIFAAPRGGFMDSSNYRKRVLYKLAEELGLPKLTFQVIRRTIATLAQKMGTVKDVQGILRHSRPGTTTDVYMQEIPESVRATVTSIHTELRSANGKRPVSSARSRKRGSKPAKRNLNPDVVLTMTFPTMESFAASGKKSPASVPGKVLEFATRMRQGRGREVAPNA